MELTMLGTGQAMVTKCYNTCFIMEEAGYQWLDIRDVFVTHKHLVNGEYSLRYGEKRKYMIHMT